MTDEEHAKAIRDAATALNRTIEAAVDAGLQVELDILRRQEIGKRFERSMVSPRIMWIVEL